MKNCGSFSGPAWNGVKKENYKLVMFLVFGQHPDVFRYCAQGSILNGALETIWGAKNITPVECEQDKSPSLCTIPPASDNVLLDS